MPKRRMIGLAMLPALALAAVFVLGGWLRTSSLGSLPLPDGDEAWFAVMSGRMAQGQPFATSTPTGNPMWLFQAPVQVPLILSLGPELWIVRSASTVAGLLAVALCAWRFSRVLDRSTAMIAAALLAALPAAVLASRTGHDVSLVPLFGTLMLAAAFRRKTAGLIASMGLGYLCHPTAVFALPAALAVYCGNGRWPEDGSAPRSWRGLALRSGLIAAIAASLAAWTALRPGTKAVMASYGIGLGAPHDPIRFASRFGRYLLAIGDTPMPVRETIFWGVVLTVAPIGLSAMIRRRQWARVALVVGALASAGSLFVLSGSEVLRPNLGRNGHGLLVPSVLAFACLLRAAVGAIVRSPAFAPGLATAAASAAGLALLLGLDLGAVDHSRCQDSRAGSAPASESIWTFGRDAPDPRLLALGEALDGRRPSGSPDDRISVVCDRWNLFWPIAFSCLDRDEVRVLDFDRLAGQLPGLLRSGGVVLSSAGGPADRAIRAAVPAPAILRVEVATDGQPPIRVVRRAPGVPAVFPAPADYDGDGRDDLASYDADSGRWTILDASGRSTLLLGPPDGIPSPGDFDGDGRAEPVLYRPDPGDWLTLTADGPHPLDVLRSPGMLPAPGDYDGDGRTEPVAFDPRRAAFVMPDPAAEVVFGHPANFGGDPLPVPGDFDGDGRDDLGVYQVDSGSWFLLRSTEAALAVSSGLPGGTPAAGDLDGDGRDDLILFLPDSPPLHLPLDPGSPSIPLCPASPSPLFPGDFDGDGRLDLLAFDPRSGTWASPDPELARSPRDSPPRR
ncbi:glycosyltransferase family 39 protein [Tautonia sociabilis]|uniref:Glycosyltransferase RgtA/B/C/D-like domain-containing protein n=1 Tax=Tautonia sociabilis TaxID=2080755 RepID=A0A432MFA6_9BACT|nr:glycosyltransferase family 39 protein [Tautonia sociabilis]RUL84643.1 hypothetical protein TsocGM_20025 [Tautonia sociabilis]